MSIDAVASEAFWENNNYGEQPRQQDEAEAEDGCENTVVTTASNASTIKTSNVPERTLEEIRARKMDSFLQSLSDDVIQFLLKFPEALPPVLRRRGLANESWSDENILASFRSHVRNRHMDRFLRTRSDDVIKILLTLRPATLAGNLRELLADESWSDEDILASFRSHARVIGLQARQQGAFPDGNSSLDSNLVDAQGQGGAFSVGGGISGGSSYLLKESVDSFSTNLLLLEGQIAKGAVQNDGADNTTIVPSTLLFGKPFHGLPVLPSWIVSSGGDDSPPGGTRRHRSSEDESNQDDDRKPAAKKSK